MTERLVAAARRSQHRLRREESAVANNPRIEAETLVAEFDRLDHAACYCSIFDECWKTSCARFDTAARVKECTRSNDPFRQ